MKVSIVVVCHDRYALASNCIKNILCHTVNPFELVLLDNGSKDRQIQLLFEEVAGLHKETRLLRLEKNIGSGPGRAYAFAHTSGDVLITLDSDTQVTTGWDVPLIDRLFAKKETAAVGALLVNADGRVHSLGGTHHNIGDKHILLKELSSGYRFTDPELRSRQFQPTWLPSGAMAIKASCYSRVQFPSDRFFNCLIDANYCFELTKAGYKLDVSPESIVYHLPNTDTGEEAKAYHRMRFDNAVLCQSILYFMDAWGRNPMLSWDCLNRLVNEPLTVKQGDCLIEQVRSFLQARNGISSNGSYRLYSLDLIAEYLRSINAKMRNGRPQNEINFIRDAADLSARYGSLLVWGLGAGGRRAAEALTRAGIRWRGFIDSDRRYAGTYHGERMVFWADNILAQKTRAPIVLASSYVAELYRRLVDVGRFEGDDFIVAPVHALADPHSQATTL